MLSNANTIIMGNQCSQCCKCDCAKADKTHGHLSPSGSVYRRRLYINYVTNRNSAQKIELFNANIFLICCVTHLLCLLLQCVIICISRNDYIM